MTNSELDKQMWEAIWQTIKGWDLERKKGDGYAGATGTDVDAILSAIQPVLAQHREAVEREARIDELERIWERNLGHNDYIKWRGSVDNRISSLKNQLKQQPELQEESDENS